MDSRRLSPKQWEELFTTPAVIRLKSSRDEDASPWERWPHGLGEISLRLFLYKLLEWWLRAEALDWLRKEEHKKYMALPLPSPSSLYNSSPELGPDYGESPHSQGGYYS